MPPAQTMQRLAVTLALALVFFTRCATTSAPAAVPAVPQVTIEKEGASWLATWHLDGPVRVLRFDRPAAGFRADTFEVLTPGYAFGKDGENEILRTDGEPQRTIRVRFPVVTRHLPKEYEFFQAFSDGSVAIYTGHLLATPDGCSDCLIRDFRFEPPPGESVIAGGERSSASLAWRDESGEGTYVYFGSIVPVESAEMISIVDPGLPEWLEDAARDAFPRLFTLFTRRFGVALPQRPTVLFNYVAVDQPGYASGGGTLSNLIELTVEGKAWERASPEGMLQLFHFLAHEAAHLWNGQIVNYPGSEDAWMHEGSADGLAERALLELGLIDEARFLDYQTAALNSCRQGLGAKPLREAAKRGEHNLYYSCGNAIALATEAASQDLFAVWRALIEQVRDAGRHNYDIDDYMAAWQRLGATAADVAELRAAVAEPSNPDTIVDLLRRNGVVTTPVESVPEDHGQILARDALAHLMGEDCAGRRSFRSDHGGFRIGEGLTCGAFAGGDLVTAIGGHDVLREGHRAWDRLHASCGAARAVRVTVVSPADPRELDVPCRTPVAARPAYLRIESRPRR